MQFYNLKKLFHDLESQKTIGLTYLIEFLQEDFLHVISRNVCPQPVAFYKSVYAEKGVVVKCKNEERYSADEVHLLLDFPYNN